MMLPPKYPVAVTPHIRQLLEETQSAGIAAQFLPTAQENEIAAEEQDDPIGDEAHSPIPGLVHRYPDRCLIKVIAVCPVYCRFCFRRASIGPGCPGLTAVQFQACIDYIQAHPEIWEVIFTGGDPLILPLKTLGTWMTQVLSIPQVQILRIHTRVPSVLPHKINTALLDILAAAEKPIYMAIHMNHPDEFTPEVEQALRQLHHVGVVLVSQTVLLKGVNDNIETLSTLMRCFIKNRVKPYYLHQGDLAPGTAHFRTRISEGRALMKALRGRFSGLCQPCYVLDIPGGYGKSPLTAEYIHGSEIEDYQGQRHKILQDL